VLRNKPTTIAINSVWE